MTTLVRPAVTGDLPAATQLVDYLWTYLDDQGGNDPRFQFIDNAAEKYMEMIRFGQGEPKLLQLVAVDVVEEKVIGILFGHVEKRDLLKESLLLYLDVAAVFPKYQRKGVMRSLVDYCENWCRQSGIGTIELRTLKTNEPGREYWRQAGYKDFYVRHRKNL